MTWSSTSWHVSESNSSECSECSNSGLVAISSASLVTWKSPRRGNLSTGMDDEQTKKCGSWRRPASQLPSSINPRSNIGLECFLLLQQTLLENQDKLLNVDAFSLFFPQTYHDPLPQKLEPHRQLFRSFCLSPVGWKESIWQGVTGIPVGSCGRSTPDE